MLRKVSPANRFRKNLMEAVGEASLDFSGYCRLAAQAMLQTAMEEEATEFIGRSSYERRGRDQSTYRNILLGPLQEQSEDFSRVRGP